MPVSAPRPDVLAKRPFALTALVLAALALASCGAIPESRGGGKVKAQAASSALSRADMRQCLSDLKDAKVRYSPLPDKYLESGCSQIGTVSLQNAGAVDRLVEVSNLGPVTCPTANRFAGWAQYGAARAARQILGSELVKIETMGSFSCRNVVGTNRLSAHGHARAIDVSAFILEDGRRISVLKHWNGTNQERAFLRTVQDSACKRFGTVLGPAYNAAHRDHFHLEYDGRGTCR